MRNLILLILISLGTQAVQGQELQAKVTVLAQKVNTQVDKKIFNTLQSQLTNLLNNRKWTKDVFGASEKIECQFLLNVESTDDANVYKGKLTVQAARPVFNSSYNAALVNFMDNDVVFKYIEYQPVEFNENRVAGSDPHVANLTAIFAFYVNIILGMDYNSFSPKAGENYFQKANNIVNNSPEGKDISGWRAFDGLRNRYWLAENLMNNRYNMIHEIIYTYYRQGLDLFYQDEATARKNVMDAFTRLQTFNQENPNTMVQQFFLAGKSTELVGLFKKAAPQDKKKFLDMLSIVDISNLDKYKEELK